MWSAIAALERSKVKAEAKTAARGKSSPAKPARSSARAEDVLAK